MNYKHGHTGKGKCTPEYYAWVAMKQRCYNPVCSVYHNYGGRGIKVCERWHNFQNFIADMGPKPDGLTLERKDNNGNYEPGNCCWATYKKQNNNRRPKSCGPAKQRWFYGHGPNSEMIIENNQHEVARIFGLVWQSISACLREVYGQHHGWTFRWI